MRARQGPTTELAVPHEAAFAEVLDAHGYLHIPQLAHIEVDGSNPCPAEKDIAGPLHKLAELLGKFLVIDMRDQGRVILDAVPSIYFPGEPGECRQARASASFF